MRALTRFAALLAALLHVGAWVAPCPQPAAPGPIAAHHAAHDASRGAQPGVAVALASAAAHVHGGANSPVSADVAMRVPCPCGCEDLPATVSDAGASPLGFALCARVGELPQLPGAPRVAREPASAPLPSIEALEHVPIPA